MANFAKLAALFGMATADSAVTDENMKTAEAKLAQLETDKAAADLRATNAEAALTTMTTRATTAEASLATATTKLTEAEGQVATLEQWKKAHASATDEREEDESNQHDQPEKRALAPWEQRAASAIANTKKRIGDK